MTVERQQHHLMETEKKTLSCEERKENTVLWIQYVGEIVRYIYFTEIKVGS